MTWAMLVPRKRLSAYGSQREQRNLMTNWSTVGSYSDVTVSQRLKRWPNSLAQCRQEQSQAVPERPPVEESQSESQSDGIIECTVGLVACQARPLKVPLEHRIGIKVPSEARIPCWMVEFAAYVVNRCAIGSDGKTPLQRLRGRREQHPDHRAWSRRSCTCPPSQRGAENGTQGSTLE